MSYRNANEILPEGLVQEIQRYVQGEQLYIPRPEGQKMGWGMKNGSRTMIGQRNRKIRELRARGAGVDDLADRFGLSPDSIRKILYT